MRGGLSLEDSITFSVAQSFPLNLMAEEFYRHGSFAVDDERLYAQLGHFPAFALFDLADGRLLKTYSLDEFPFFADDATVFPEKDLVDEEEDQPLLLGTTIEGVMGDYLYLRVEDEDKQPYHVSQYIYFPDFIAHEGDEKPSGLLPKINGHPYFIRDGYIGNGECLLLKPADFPEHYAHALASDGASLYAIMSSSKFSLREQEPILFQTREPDLNLQDSSSVVAKLNDDGFTPLHTFPDTAHSLAVQDDYLYVQHGDESLSVIDKEHGTLIGTFNINEVTPDSSFADKAIFLGSPTNRMKIARVPIQANEQALYVLVHDQVGYNPRILALRPKLLQH